MLRGTPLPVTRTETFATAADNQSTVDATAFMGERPLPRDNARLGNLRIEGLPQGQGKVEVKIEFSVSRTCELTVRAVVPGMQSPVLQTLDPPVELSPEYVAQQLAEAESHRAQDEAQLSRIEAIRKAKGLITQANEKLKLASDDKLNKVVAALGLALESNDVSSIREQSDVLSAALTHLTSSATFNEMFGSFFTAPASPNRAQNRAARQTRTEPAAPNRSAATTSATSGGFTPGQRLTTVSSQQALGKIFGGATFTLDPQLCFVLMPFDSKFQPVYENQIKPAVRTAGLTCLRADDIQSTNQITWDIWEHINRARFLIADLTDQNPNVFYELGLAHALSKDVILITQSMEFVPFDLKAIRCVVYTATPNGKEKLTRDLAASIGVLMRSG